MKLPIAELEAKNRSLRAMANQDNDINLDDEIARLQKKSIELTEKTFANLDAWQVSKMSRHPNRLILLTTSNIFSLNLKNLRAIALLQMTKQSSAVGAFRRQTGNGYWSPKGRTVKDKVKRNFGMPAPEGYRKALRLMQMAERFKLPIITFIDTPGAYPGCRRGRTRPVRSDRS